MSVTVLLLAVIAMLGTSLTLYADAAPPFDSKMVYDYSEVILVGRIVSVNSTFSPTYNLYQIQVEKYLKGAQNNNFVFAAGSNTVSSKAGNSVFELDDRALFFLNNDTVGHDQYRGIFGVLRESKLADPYWDECKIFEKDIPREHWVFGGRITPSLSQQGNTDADSFEIRKRVMITYDLVNHTPTSQNVEVGIQIRNTDDPNSLYIFTEISSHLLEACTQYHTLSWGFTPNKPGRYAVEFYNLTGSKTTLSFTASDANLAVSPLKQYAAGIPANQITCKAGLELTFRSINGAPACVNPETKQKLVERGWAKTATVENTEIPWSTMGSGNDDGITVGFNRAILDALPDAGNYYDARADQLIPFDIPVIIEWV